MQSAASSPESAQSRMLRSIDGGNTPAGALCSAAASDSVGLFPNTIKPDQRRSSAVIAQQVNPIVAARQVDHVQASQHAQRISSSTVSTKKSRNSSVHFADTPVIAAPTASPFVDKVRLCSCLHGASCARLHTLRSDNVYREMCLTRASRHCNVSCQVNAWMQRVNHFLNRAHRHAHMQGTSNGHILMRMRESAGHTPRHSVGSVVHFPSDCADGQVCCCCPAYSLCLHQVQL